MGCREPSAARATLLWQVAPEGANRVGKTMRVSVKTLLASVAAIVALWAPAYLAWLDHVGFDAAAESKLLQWALLTVGVAGLATVLYVAWRDTRDPAWRAAHPQLGPAPRGARHD